MPVEYVYALHDFAPEHDDEVSFRAGERIEVIEKDDLYGDGWWQGRNLAGQTGLFPQSYTTPAPPAATATSPPSSVPALSASPTTSTPLQSLEEESDSPVHSASPNPTTSNGNGNHHHHERVASQGEEVMRATMTDVQKAIEQLGRGNRDGARSFSFASTREGDVTDRESESDALVDSDAEGEGWHRDARQRLAEEARKANARAAAKEAAQLESLRASVPPIEVELSDESDDEGDIAAASSTSDVRRHSHITEVDEEDMGPALMAIITNSSTEQEAPAVPSHELYLPPADESEAQTATARRTSFPAIYPPVQASASMDSVAPPTPTSPSASDSQLPINDTPSSQRLSVENKTAPSSTSTTIISAAPTLRDVTSALPSPAASSIQVPHPQSIIVTAASASPPALHADPPELAPSSDEALKKPSMSPTDWTVEDVVEWLKSKGFDQSVCDKFIEQEITGDVLLELDANLLKTEIGIAAFGKRVRIANAIQELRRPPSIVSSDRQPTQILTQASPTQEQSQSFSHSRSHSYSHSHSHSIQSSVPSVGRSPTTPATANTMSTAPESAGFSSMIGSDSGPGTGDFTIPSPDARTSTKEFLESRRTSARSNINAVDADHVGLGLAVPGEAVANGKHSNRPAHLMLSPSDGALGASAKAASVDQLLDERGEDRAALSEGETAQISEGKVKKARRMFGRSTDSSSLKEKDSSKQTKEAASPHSATSKRESTKSDEQSVNSRHTKGKRSVDASASKSSDRLSLFGSTFSSTLGKSRKPPPRYSSYVDNADLTSEKSHTGLSKIYSGSKRSSGRPSTADGSTHRSSFKEKPKSPSPKEGEKRPERLRKRTISTSEPTSVPRGLLGNQLKPGQSVLEQIGTPDHNGWMRKKGERYNTWKLRYFVLKGPHLYYLRSNNKSETKIKGYINIVGYRIITDENVDPGRYGFKIVHDTAKAHFFSSDEQLVIREWMKALMKATIGRDYTKPVVSSCNVPTIPLTVAQAMNPAPRPPSPGARAATQKALRRENPNQLSSRDARILMGLPSPAGTDGKEPERARLDTFFMPEAASSHESEVHTPKIPSPKGPVPPRPSREMRRLSTAPSSQSESHGEIDLDLVEWANSHLPQNLQISGSPGSLYGGLALLRLAESIKGKPSSPPVPDSAFPTSSSDDKIDGLFRLFDFLLDNDVKMGTVSINDVRQGKRDKVVQLLKALKAWEDKRRILAQSISNPTLPLGAYMSVTGPASPAGLPWSL